MLGSCDDLRGEAGNALSTLAESLIEMLRGIHKAHGELWQACGDEPPKGIALRVVETDGGAA